MTWIQRQRLLRETSLPADAAARFGATGAPEPFSVGANAVFLFQRDDGEAYLKLSHSDARSRGELDAGLAYLRHLFERGAPVSEPLSSGDGVGIETLTHADDTWRATAQRAVPGKPLGNRATDPVQYRAWGLALGELHRAAEDFQPAEDAELYSVDRQWTDLRARVPSDDDPLVAEAEALSSWLQSLERTPQNFGLIHGDQNAGNAIWDGARVRIIDFDEPMANWWAADVARPFNEVRDREPEQIGSWVAALLDGYRGVVDLDDASVQDLPWFLRLHSLSAYLWLLKAWDDPEAIGGGSREEQLIEHRARVLNPLRF